MTELAAEKALWPTLMARVRALPEGDVLAFELEGCGVAIQGELERLRLELAAAKAASELSTAEMDALERCVQARQAELRLREHHPDNAIQTEHWKRREQVDVAEAIRSRSIDALLALRAQEEEG